MRRFIHRVCKNETISDIEQKYNMPKRLILRINNVTNIHEGQWLVINNYDCVWHVVQPFETLDSISEKYNVTIDSIKEFNDIKNVFIGMSLAIKKEEN